MINKNKKNDINEQKKEDNKEKIAKLFGRKSKRARTFSSFEVGFLLFIFL